MNDELYLHKGGVRHADLFNHVSESLRQSYRDVPWRGAHTVLRTINLLSCMKREYSVYSVTDILITQDWNVSGQLEHIMGVQCCMALMQQAILLCFQPEHDVNIRLFSTLLSVCWSSYYCFRVGDLRETA